MAGRGAVGLVLFVLTATALSGCLGSDTAPSSPAPEPATVAPEVEETKASDDGLSAFAQRLEEKFHTHDAWNGKHQLKLMDADVSSGPLVPDPNGPAGPLGALTIFAQNGQRGFGGGLGARSFELPPNQVVPSETEWLEVQVRWDGSPAITGIRLGYQTAAMKFMNVTAPLEPAKIVKITTTLQDNDIPHMSVSKWRFGLFPNNDQNPGSPGVFNGTARVTVTAMRTSDSLFVAPPHPDWWGDNTTMNILNVTRKASQKWVVFPVMFPGLAEGEGFGQIPIPNGTIVPPHTKALKVEIKWTNNDMTTSATAPKPAIGWSPANSRRADNHEADKVTDASAEYSTELDPRMWDSPYDSVSNWQFFTYLDSNMHTDGLLPFGPFGQVATFDGEYTVKITAYRDG